MRHREIMSPIDWARRVNRSWLVRSNLNEHTDAWLDHLAELDDERLLKSCEIARGLCDRRGAEDDPKPWFYAGLFQLATVEEARRFLETHRVTKSLVPAMAEDPDVLLWLDRVGPETRELISRLRRDVEQLRTLMEGGPAEARPT